MRFAQLRVRISRRTAGGAAPWCEALPRGEAYGERWPLHETDLCCEGGHGFKLQVEQLLGRLPADDVGEHEQAQILDSPFYIFTRNSAGEGTDFPDFLPRVYQMQVLQQLILENRQAGEGLGSISSFSSLPPPFPSCVRPWRTHHDARACFVLRGRRRARQTREGEKGGGLGGGGERRKSESERVY